MTERNGLNPNTICDVGCGAGEVLNLLWKHYDGSKACWNYETSPYAFELCAPKAKPNLTFVLGDLLAGDGAHFDLVMAIDVVEHIEDYIGFLRSLKTRGVYKLFRVPLELHVSALLRNRLMESREKNVHLHYFTKETVLADLVLSGYEIIDHFYVLNASPNPIKTKLMKLPRRAAFLVNRDLAVKLPGGWSLLVLAR